VAGLKNRRNENYPFGSQGSDSLGENTRINEAGFYNKETLLDLVIDI
jgi:hypothetical protein